MGGGLTGLKVVPPFINIIIIISVSIIITISIIIIIIINIFIIIILLLIIIMLLIIIDSIIKFNANFGIYYLAWKIFDNRFDI